MNIQCQDFLARFNKCKSKFDWDTAYLSSNTTPIVGTKEVISKKIRAFSEDVTRASSKGATERNVKPSKSILKFCPITAVAFAETGQYYTYRSYKQAAKMIGLDSFSAETLAFTADGYPYNRYFDDGFRIALVKILQTEKFDEH